ncbi:uncharacterized protein G2W53_025538 [Senna tora]|uniref:Uncharacterized protein n=1 Tax=Senna tora TaxID=362788 RepID=A0A834WGK7_9FABA|nr:uncharacterized protein G2W53_025538 [Senna tora]
MNSGGGRRNKKKAVREEEELSWKEKKEIADKEEDVLRKDINDLETWADMIDSMNEENLKEYLKNRPDDLKQKRGKKCKTRVQCTGKSKSSTCNAIMASVWKFHKE